jgi:hypothetical protein
MIKRDISASYLFIETMEDSRASKRLGMAVEEESRNLVVNEGEGHLMNWI